MARVLKPAFSAMGASAWILELCGLDRCPCLKITVVVIVSICCLFRANIVPQHLPGGISRRLCGVELTNADCCRCCCSRPCGLGRTCFQSPGQGAQSGAQRFCRY